MTIVDWMNQLLVHKKSWEEHSETDRKTFNSFIINRWLSMDMEFIEIVNYFQKYSIGQLKPKEVYKWYCDILPKGKRYNKYIKGRKTKKYDKLLVSTLITYFECSSKQAIEYIELMDTRELREILEMYGIDKKQIKKVCK